MLVWIVIRPQLVLRTVAEFYGYTTALLRNKARYKELVRARDAFVWLVRERKLMSWNSIARMLDRCHTTCIASHRRAQKRIDTDPLFAQEIAFIEALLDAPRTSYTTIAIH